MIVPGSVNGIAAVQDEVASRNNAKEADGSAVKSYAIQKSPNKDLIGNMWL